MNPYARRMQKEHGREAARAEAESELLLAESRVEYALTEVRHDDHHAALDRVLAAQENLKAVVRSLRRLIS